MSLASGWVDLESEVYYRFNTGLIWGGVCRLALGWVDLESEV